MFGWFRKYVRKIGIFGIEVEFRPPADVAAHNPGTQPPTLGNTDPVVSTSNKSESGQPNEVPSRGGKGKTFEEVIQAIRELHPYAPLGRTAEQGLYRERAGRLANYQMYEGNPVCYVAVQPNGKVMWLYLGRGGKICCGDKE